MVQRNMKGISFADVNDGSTVKNLQIVFDKDKFEKPVHASSVYAKGIVALAPKGHLELRADDFQIIGLEMV